MMYSKFDSESENICSDLLKKNKVLILPTDTVYGFSGIVGTTDAEIRKIKGREETKPFIQLIAKPTDLFNITNDNIPMELLCYWPGPLTIIVHDKNNLDNTIAVRCPGDSWLRSVIEKVGSPLYSTSVNRSGSPVLQKINEIKDEFENEVAAIIDAGDSKNGIPSTIVKIENNKVIVVRAGAVSIKDK